MRRLLAIVLVGLLSLTAPAFAQTGPNSGNQNAPQSGPDGQPPADPSGLDALAQAPPGPDLTGLIVGGLAIGGLVTVIVVATQNNNNNNTTTPASP